MRTPLAALLVLSLTLGACGAVRESRLNPFNWFGGSREVATDTAADSTRNPLIPTRRGLFADREVQYRGNALQQITGLDIDRVPDGAIVRVTAIAQRADAYNIKMVKQETEDASLLHYELQGEFPPIGRDTIRRQRPVVTAIHLSEQDLEGIRRIRVSGASNARESRR